MTHPAAGYSEGMRLLRMRTRMAGIEQRRQAGARRERRVVAVACALLVAGLTAVPSSAHRSPRPARLGLTAARVLTPAPVPAFDAVSRDTSRRPVRLTVACPAPLHRLVRLHQQRSDRDGVWATTLPPPALRG